MVSKINHFNRKKDRRFLIIKRSGGDGDADTIVLLDIDGGDASNSGTASLEIDGGSS